MIYDWLRGFRAAILFSGKKFVSVSGPQGFNLVRDRGALIMRMESTDGTNRLAIATIHSMALEVEGLGVKGKPEPIIITGSPRFFSAGADLNEIAGLSAADGYDFALAGQGLMSAIDRYPAPVVAAIDGYCMGGGLDLALACDSRICSPSTIFGHRGAALGIMTGWGGTQRLPRLIGKSRALQMFIAAEKVAAPEALSMGLVDAVSPDPLKTAMDWVNGKFLESRFHRNS